MNEADVAPAGIVTREGKERFPELLEIVTTAPVERAGRLNPSTQESDLLGATVVGLQAKLTSCGVVETTDSVTLFEVPPYVAVIKAE